MVRRKTNTFSEGKFAQLRRQQHRDFRCWDLEQIPVAFVTLPYSPRNARLVQARVPCSRRNRRVSAPVFVRDPCRGCQMLSWHNESAWLGGKLWQEDEGKPFML
jgi:hypothetical protein